MFTINRRKAVWIRRTLGDIDPLNKVRFRRARSRIKKGPRSGVPLILPRNHESRTDESRDSKAQCHWPPVRRKA